MPVIKVWCLPDMDESALNRLHQNIVSAVCGVEELGLKSEHDITTLFPADKMVYGVGTDIIVEVTGLLEKPERTKVVRQRLAQSLGVAVSKFFPNAKVESFIYPDNPKRDAFWCSEQDQTTPELDEDGMIIWTGGDRPVNPDVVVDVKVQGGIPRMPVKAGEWPQICWRHRPDDNPKHIWNIVAYKVLG